MEEKNMSKKFLSENYKKKQTEDLEKIEIFKKTLNNDDLTRLVVKLTEFDNDPNNIDKVLTFMSRQVLIFQTQYNKQLM